MRNTRLDEAQAGIEIGGRNINNLRYADNTTFVAESEELKNFLMKVKEGNEKIGSKLNIQKTKIMTHWSHHFMENRWGKSGNSNKFYLLGLQNQITVDGDCSHEIKRHMLLGRKAVADKSRQHIRKQRHHFANKGLLIKAMIFPVVMYGCESWTGKKAEH